jgi:Ca-activated chloride channel family protein
MESLAAFHFLRPYWLWLLLPMGLVLWSILRSQDPSRAWKEVITPELLEHLVIRQAGKRTLLRPAWLAAGLCVIGAIALAGPAWQKEPTPFTEDQAALFIVMKVTPDMLAQDIQPNRLERAAQKIGDLLDLRPGSKSGLVAYAGSAHLVMPLTSDPEVIRYFASELSPEVMPESGDDPVSAARLAVRRLGTSGLPGSVVLVADQVDPVSHEELANLHDESGINIHVYAIAAGPEVVPPVDSPPAAPLDEKTMREAAGAGGGALITVTPDDSDVQALSARLERSIASAPAQEGERWRDMGYFLLWPVILGAALFWRRGGGVELRS